MDRLKLKPWLDRLFWNTEREEGPCVKLVLKHLDSNGSPGKVEVWSQKIPHKGQSVTFPAEEIPELMSDIQHASHDDAEGMAAGTQRYQLLSYVEHKPHAHSRFNFTMAASTSDDVDDTGATEPANMKGLLAQLMRHNAETHRASNQVIHQTHYILAKTVTSQQEYILKMENDRRDSLGMMEDLLSQRHERDLRSMEAENKEKRQQALFETGKLLLPAVVNKISGKKILPEETTPAEMMIRGLAESLTQEQLHKLMPILSPPQQIALVNFMSATQEDEPETKQLSSGTDGKNGSN